VVPNLIFVGNIVYPDHHLPRWYKAAFFVVLLYSIAKLAYLAFHARYHRANGFASAAKKNAPLSVAATCILGTSMAFVGAAFFTDEQVPVLFVKVYFLAILVSAVLFIIGERSSTPQRTEEDLTLSTRT